MDIKKFLKELRQYWIQNEIPNITDANVKFLQDLIAKNKCKKALEIGTANWYSTICIALALAKNKGHITSIEFSKLSHDQAIKNIECVWLEKICTLICDNAISYIPKIKESDFDFVFIDWMKKRTKDFFELIYPKVIPNWIIIIDDVIKFKDKMASFYEYLAINKIKYKIIQIDPDDGVMMIIKSCK